MSDMPIGWEILGARYVEVGRIGEHEKVRKMVLPSEEVVRYECLINGCRSDEEGRLKERKCQKFTFVGW